MTYPIPEKALHQHIIVLGKTGAGKSSLLRSAFIEPLLDASEPVCIVDPKGDHWGLKSSADGKRAGYAVVIFGGEHADVPLNPRAGAHVAELVATGNRPCIIDLGGWMIGERTRFFIDFASMLFKHARGRRWLVLDEVHNFAPQGKILDPDAGKMLHWANRLASEGRGKGINIIAASQRPQKVHKDFVTSMETLLAMRVIHKLDRDAIKDWIDGCADPAKGREVVSTLAGMQRGETWAWSPELDFGPKRIQVPLFWTYDSFKPQSADTGKLKGWAEVDLVEVQARLETVVREAEENDPKALRKRIAELERQVSQPGASRQEVDAARRKGLDEGYAAASAAIAGKVLSVIRAGDDFMQRLRGISEAIEKTAPLASKAAVPALHRPVLARLSAPAPASPPRQAAVGGTSDLPKGEAATLAACIQFPDGLRREQLTVLTGYKRSSRDTYIQRLREKGLVDTSGDRVVATEAGQAALPDAEPLPTGIDLQNYWMQRLPEGERKILQVLIERQGDPVARTELDELTGYKRSSRDTYLQRLSSKQLIADAARGEVRASEDLF